MTHEEIRQYLDECITFWRQKRDQPMNEQSYTVMCTHYIDAYQSVRKSVFGEVLP